MPGRLMSISTTSGFTCGKSFTASSALAYWLTQLKPSARFSTRASVVRNWSLSSTMDTEMGIILNGLQRNVQAHEGSALGAGDDGKLSADIFHPFFHVTQAVPVLRGRGTAQPAPVVFDLQNKSAGRQPQPDPGFGRLRVLDHIIDGFLEGEKNMVTDFRRNVGRGQVRRDIGAITQPGEREIFLRVFAGTIGETFQGVVGGSDAAAHFPERG